MKRTGLAFGLNTKKPAASRPTPLKKPMFAIEDDDSDPGQPRDTSNLVDISGDIDSFLPTDSAQDFASSSIKNRTSAHPPRLKSKTKSNAMFGDLSTSLSARKNAEAAEEFDSSVYEYDAVYDSLKQKPKVDKVTEDRKPKYMRNLIQAAEVRKRDALIAEEKKIAREREEEGDEFQDKERFVTDAYRRQQEENRRIEEEEKRREEAEAKKNEGTGLASFYKNLLNKESERHAQTVKASELAAKDADESRKEPTTEPNEDTSESDRIKQLQQAGASVTINEDGQVVDMRELLRGGLNVGAKKKTESEQQAAQKEARERDRSKDFGGGPQWGRKQGMRERQSRMVAEQLEQTMKRTLEAEEAQRAEVERAAKSRKTEGEISSARERYLARKKAAEEEKKNAVPGDG